MPLLEKACIRTWKKLSKNYEIKRWDESTFDINKANVYVKQAYENKKYAFVSDYVRLYALYKYGGIYMDTDMEVFRDFGQLLKNRNLVIGFEFKEYISSAFIAASPQNPIIKELLDTYESRVFQNPDGTIDTTPINFKWNEILRKHGIIPNGSIQLIDDTIFVGSQEFFNSCSSDWISQYTHDTYTVHHYSASWCKKTLVRKVKNCIISYLILLIGFKNCAKIQSFIRH